jgi:hypothetical protein
MPETSYGEPPRNPIGMVDHAIEQLQISTTNFFTSAEDAMTGAAAAIFMPFIKPVDAFIPEGDGLDSDEEEEDERKGKVTHALKETEKAVTQGFQYL